MLRIIHLLKKPKIILILILLSTAFLRLYRLDFPNKYIFDEVYHAFTAKEYLALHKEAWEWWTTPPPGVAYEWTHPPLAKEIMAISMFLTRSQDGWAWRLPGVFLGTLSVFLIYQLGMLLFKSPSASLIAAFAFSIDGLNFVQSRVGMNDIYFVTFMLVSVLFLLKRRYLLSAIFASFSLASKWAALYLFLMIFAMLLKDRQFKKLLYFIFIPILIYLISYIPFFSLGHSLEQFKGLQQQMWWYHTSLLATHDYSSHWWSWPINLYPVWYAVDYKENTIANIFASGNPAVFWVGSAALILTGLEAIKKRSVNLLVIILGFLVFWLPWAVSPRIMFLYHFSPSVPFLALSLGYQLRLELQEQKRRKLIFVLLIMLLINFLLIFPFLTGIHLPRGLIELFFATNLTKNPF